VKVIGIHHIAFAERKAEISGSLQRLFGLSISPAEPGAGFVERMLPVGPCFLQALQPTGPGVVQSSVDRRGTGLHHIALQVEDVRSALEELARSGARLIDAAPRNGGMRSQIGFVHPQSTGGVLVELVQIAADSVS
jgi:methylmalonyl-CoA/ethylmalonyl-CoA epimerase